MTPSKNTSKSNKRHQNDWAPYIPHLKEGALQREEVKAIQNKLNGIVGNLPNVRLVVRNYKSVIISCDTEAAFRNLIGNNRFNLNVTNLKRMSMTVEDRRANAEREIQECLLLQESLDFKNNSGVVRNLIYHAPGNPLDEKIQYFVSCLEDEDAVEDAIGHAVDLMEYTLRKFVEKGGTRDEAERIRKGYEKEPQPVYPTK